MIIELESIFNNDGSSYEFDYELSLSHIFLFFFAFILHHKTKPKSTKY